MSTGKFSTGYKKKPSSEPAAPSKKAPPKATVTVHPDGHVTATGPEAKRAVKETKEGAKRVKRAVKTTKTEEHGRSVAKSLQPDISRPLPPRTALNIAKLLRPVTAYTKAHPQPENAYAAARRGEAPPRALEREFGKKVFDKAADIAYKTIAAKEALKEDPAAEFVISTAATAGLGGVAGLAGKAIGDEAGSALARAGEGIASKEATGASTAAEKALQKVAVKLKEAPAKSKTVQAVKNTPARTIAKAGKKYRSAKAAPGKAKAAVKKAPELKTASGRAAAGKAIGRSAKHRPVRTGYLGALAVPNGAVPGDIGKRARAFAAGSWDAAIHHPWETAQTTARGLEGAITGPAALGAAGVESAIEQSPDPLIATGKEQFQGLIGTDNPKTPKVDEEGILTAAFSGDPKKAEEAARKKGSLSILTPLPAISRTPLAKGLVEDARGASSAVRRTVATTDKLPGKDWRNRNIRHAPKGTTENVTALSERHFARTRTAKAWQRIHGKHSVPADRHAGRVLDDLAKAPKGSHIALQTLAEYGIRDKRGADHIREHGPGDKQLTAALDYAELHPEIFESNAFKAALEHSEEAVAGHPASQAEVGERARVLPQGDALGITRPEHRVPVDRRDEFGGATTWAEAAEKIKKVRVKQRAALKDAERQAAQLGRKGGRKSGLGDLGVSAIKEDLKRSGELLAEAKKGETQKANVRTRTKWVTKDGKKVKVKYQVAPYTDKELKEYVGEVEAGRQSVGLHKAIWTHHTAADSERGTDLNLAPSAARKEYAREGRLAKADNLDRSLEGFIRGTIQRPRYNAANKEFFNHLAEEEKVPFTIDGHQRDVGMGSKEWREITSPRTKDNPNGGQFDPRSITRFPLRQWEHAVGDPFKTDAQRSAEMRTILSEAREGRINGHEPWIPIRREVLKEAEGQINANHNGFVTFINGANRVASRSLLATNPAWLIAQAVAEGIPMIISHPSYLSPVHLPLMLRKIYKDRKENPEAAMAVQATAGAAPTSTRFLNTPIDEEGVLTPEAWDKSAEAMTRGKSLKNLISFAKLRSLPEADIRRQNLYREMIYRAQRDKKFRKWYSGMTGWFDGAAEISKKFKGKSDRELQDWLNSDDPQAKAWNKKLAEHVDDVAGNWTAFTRYEKDAAPFVLFYSFLRYSIRWALWAYPKSHPVRATLLNLMGQVNANQLEKLIGHKPGNPAAFAVPIWNTGGVDEGQYKKLLEEGVPKDQAKFAAEHEVLPGGTRISASQSSLTNAVTSKNPAAVAQSLNPLIGAAATATYGVDTFTNEKLREPQGVAALNELIELPTPLRIAGVKIGGAHSALGEAFSQYDKNKDFRSAGFPFIPRSGADLLRSERLAKGLQLKYGEGHQSGPYDDPLFLKMEFGNNGGIASKAERKKAIEAVHRSERASNFVKSKEGPFLGHHKDLTPEQEQFQEEWEDAWQGGPNAPPKSISEQIKEEVGLGGSGKSPLDRLKEEVGLSGKKSIAEELREEVGLR